MKKIFVILTLLILNGCGGVQVERVDSCIPQVSIIVTDDIDFYLVKVGNKPGYSSLKNQDVEDNYLCISEKTKYKNNTCKDLYGDIPQIKLTPNAIIEFDGTAVKQRSWGIYTIDAGEAPLTYFKGKINSDIIYVNTFDLMSLYETKELFKEKNKETFNRLKFNKRMPPSLLIEKDGNITQQSWEDRRKIEVEEIYKWKCNQ